jgi:hypothetical protein
MMLVSVKQLVSAIEEAEAFSLPDMKGGTRYIYDNLYGRLSRGMELRLSDIDFERFELDDIDSMRTLYSDTLEVNEIGAERLTNSLRNIAPAPVLSAFI